MHDVSKIKPNILGDSWVKQFLVRLSLPYERTPGHRVGKIIGSWFSCLKQTHWSGTKSQSKTLEHY